MAEHELKMIPVFFQPAWDGEKPFEIRRNDRMYQKGDTLRLREYDSNPMRDCEPEERYTGRMLTVTVTYVMTGDKWGLREGYVVLATQILAKYDPPPEEKEGLDDPR